MSTFPLSFLFTPFLLVLLIFFLPLFSHILGFRLLDFFWLGTRFPKYKEFPALGQGSLCLREKVQGGNNSDFENEYEISE